MPQIDRRINCYFSETLSTLPCSYRWNHSAKKLTFPIFYLLCGSAGQAAWFTVDVIKRLTVCYLRRLSEKKQKPCFLLCLEGGFFFCFARSPFGDIADMNQNLSKGFLIR